VAVPVPLAAGGARGAGGSVERLVPAALSGGGGGGVERLVCAAPPVAGSGPMPALVLAERVGREELR